jgi:hypothetical protein
MSITIFSPCRNVHSSWQAWVEADLTTIYQLKPAYNTELYERVFALFEFERTGEELPCAG